MPKFQMLTHNALSVTNLFSDYLTKSYKL